MIFKEQANVAYPDLTEMQRPHLTLSQRAVLKWATIEEYDRVLGVDCGNGALLNHVSQRFRLDACGMCTSADQAHAARDYLEEADIVYAQAADIPFRSASFDEVFVTNNLRSNCSREALDEILRVLRPGGQIVIACSLLKVLSGITGIENDSDLSRKELMRVLQQAGFKDVSWRSAGLIGVVIGWKQDNLR